MVISNDRLLSFHVHTCLTDMIKDDPLQLVQMMMSNVWSLLLLSGAPIIRWVVLLLVLSVCVLSPNHLV